MTTLAASAGVRTLGFRSGGKVSLDKRVTSLHVDSGRGRGVAQVAVRVVRESGRGGGIAALTAVALAELSSRASSAVGPAGRGAGGQPGQKRPWKCHGGAFPGAGPPC